MSEESESYTQHIFPHYQENDRAKLLNFVNSTVLGTIITHSATHGIQCAQIPFSLHHTNNKDTLKCHFPRVNQSQLETILSHKNKDTTVLIVFNGPQHYISSNWFPSKHKTHRFVPTWNYTTVHVQGKLIQTTHNSENATTHTQFLEEHLSALSSHCEELVGEEKPWKLTDAQPGYLATLYPMLHGLEFEIVDIQGKIKTNQDKPTEINGVINALDNLIQNPHKYASNDNVNNSVLAAQCPLAMKSLVENKGLTNDPMKSNATGNKVSTCNNDCGCPITALFKNPMILWAIIIILFAMVVSKS